jgi:hypothetical protein
MLILLDDLAQCVAMRTATPVQRIAARIRATRLDRDLAAGASPDSSPLLALRAQALVRPSMRRALARRVQQLLDDAAHEEPTRVVSARVPVRRERILPVADALRLLIDRLLTPGPVPARGVAVVHDLLTDGAGPLYYVRGHDDLLDVVLDAVEQLAPLSAW